MIYYWNGSRYSVSFRANKNAKISQATNHSIRSYEGQIMGAKTAALNLHQMLLNESASEMKGPVLLLYLRFGPCFMVIKFSK